MKLDEITGTSVIVALTVAVLVKGLEWFQAWLKFRRETQNDKDQLEVLRDINSNMRQVRDGQIAQNGKLATVVQVNELHHAELLRALKDRCPAVQQINMRQGGVPVIEVVEKQAENPFLKQTNP